MDESNIRSELINKAVEVFSLKGYAAANLTDITDALKLSRGPIYYHFKDKHGLFTAAYDAWEKELLDNNARIYADASCGVLDILEKTVYNCLGLYKRFRANFFTGIETIPELSVLGARFSKATTLVYDMKLEAVEKAIRAGELRSDTDPRLVVQMIYVLYDGLRFAWERAEIPMTDENARHIIEIHMQGIARAFLAAPAARN